MVSVDMSVHGQPIWDYLTAMFAIARNAETFSMRLERTHAAFASLTPEQLAGTSFADVEIDRSPRCSCCCHNNGGPPSYASRYCRTHVFSSLDLINEAREEEGMGRLEWRKAEGREFKGREGEEEEEERRRGGGTKKNGGAAATASSSSSTADDDDNNGDDYDINSRFGADAAGATKEGVDDGGDDDDTMDKRGDSSDGFYLVDTLTGERFYLVVCHAAITDGLGVDGSDIPTYETAQMRTAIGNNTAHANCKYCFENTGRVPEAEMGASGVNVAHCGTLTQFANELLRAFCPLTPCSSCRPHFSIAARGFLAGSVHAALLSPQRPYLGSSMPGGSGGAGIPIVDLRPPPLLPPLNSATTTTTTTTRPSPLLSSKYPNVVRSSLESVLQSKRQAASAQRLSGIPVTVAAPSPSQFPSPPLYPRLPEGVMPIHAHNITNNGVVFATANPDMDQASIIKALSPFMACPIPANWPIHRIVFRVHPSLLSIETMPDNSGTRCVLDPRLVNVLSYVANEIDSRLVNIHSIDEFVYEMRALVDKQKKNRFAIIDANKAAAGSSSSTPKDAEKRLAAAAAESASTFTPLEWWYPEMIRLNYISRCTPSSMWTVLIVIALTIPMGPRWATPDTGVSEDSLKNLTKYMSSSREAARKWRREKSHLADKSHADRLERMIYTWICDEERCSGSGDVASGEAWREFETAGAKRRAFYAMLEKVAVLCRASSTFRTMSAYVWPVPTWVNDNGMLVSWLIQQELHWTVKNTTATLGLLDRLLSNSITSLVSVDNVRRVGPDEATAIQTTYDVNGRDAWVRSLFKDKCPLLARDAWVVRYVRATRMHYESINLEFASTMEPMATPALMPHDDKAASSAIEAKMREAAAAAASSSKGDGK